MTDPIFEHEKLDVYRLALDCVADSFVIAKNFPVFTVTLAINGHDVDYEHEHEHEQHFAEHE